LFGGSLSQGLFGGVNIDSPAGNHYHNFAIPYGKGGMHMYVYDFESMLRKLVTVNRGADKNINLRSNKHVNSAKSFCY
jgi:hypothetical protein